MTAYVGTVCYQDGWHYSITEDPDTGHQTPDQKLFLEDDGTYRLAEDGDESWEARKHVRYALIAPGDGKPGLMVSPEEFEMVQQMLDEKRAEVES